jgi:hypothetical protein
MADVTQTSGFLSLNWKDLGKGLIVAVIGAVVTPIYSSLEAGSLVINWKQVLTIGLTAGLSYLLKNLFTPAQTVVNKTVLDDNGDGLSDPNKPKPDKP